MADPPIEPQVLIVGAGPTGLTLAAELARFGVSYRVIDRSPTAARWSEALVVQARTLEQFERYGIAETAVARGRQIHRATIISEGKLVMQLDLDKIHSRYSYALFLPQSETERLLTDYLIGLGGHIEREVELESFQERQDGVLATLRHASGQTEQAAAGWIVGCDGAHSRVRQQLGVPFEGDSVDFSFFLGDMRISGNNVPGDELRVYLHRGNVVFIGRLTETTYRVIVALHDQQQAEPNTAAQPETDLTVEDFQRAVDAYADPGLRLSEPEWITPFRINQRKAPHYRVRHAFLAGDAAHIHSPVAGQGMNTGIQDAANLAWKLSAVMRGAPESLLDSYDEERGAVGKALIATTSRGLAAATIANPTLEMIRDRVFSWLGGLSFVQERARNYVSETAIHYHHSSIVKDCGGKSPLRAGDRAPDATYRDAEGREHRLHEALTSPGHLLLLLHVSDARKAPLTGIWPEARMLALHPYPDEPLAQVYGSSGQPTLYAIRPDGYIGFRGGIDDIGSLAAYARQVHV